MLYIAGVVAPFVCVTFVFGYWLGVVRTSRYWSGHAGPSRSAVYCSGLFYYVIPEAEYTSLEMLRWDFAKLKEECQL